MKRQPNPTQITVLTPECVETVENVETWWREDGDLVVQTLDGERRTFLLGEIIAGAN